MCTSYRLLAENNDELSAILRQIHADYPDVAVTTGRVAPSQTAAVLTARGARPMTFGMHLPGKKGLLLNARSERADQSPLFAPLLHSSRCLVPASDFYEWSATKEAYLFEPKQERTLYMAGLYVEDQPFPRFVIITREADEQVAPVHGRMPLLLASPELRHAWLHAPQLALALLRSQPDVPLGRRPEQK